MHIFRCIFWALLNFWHIGACFLLHVFAHMIYLHISCIFLIEYFGIFIELHISGYRHIFCIFQTFLIFRIYGVQNIMDISWAHLVLQLCAEITS